MLNYTGQRLDGTGLLFYNARYYDPAIGRFISADTVVPGNASGGMDGVALRPLTVAFHEPGFIATLNGEGANADKLHWGGPVNPQALNRYSYVLNNPMRWTDPSGHDVVLDYDQAVYFKQNLKEMRDAAQDRANRTTWFWSTWLGGLIGATGNIFTTLGAALGGGAVSEAGIGDALANPGDTQTIELMDWMLSETDSFLEWVQNPNHPERKNAKLTFGFEAAATSDPSRPFQYYIVAQYGKNGPRHRTAVSPAMYFTHRKVIGDARRPKG